MHITSQVGSQSTEKDEPHTVMRANPLLIKPPPPVAYFPAIFAGALIGEGAYTRGKAY